MKKYFDHVKSKAPHHRRQHAAQIAGLLTALAFVVWITTLGFRFAGTAPVAAAPDDGSGVEQTQLAGVAASDTSNTSGVEVVGTSTGTAFSNYSDTGATQ